MKPHECVDVLEVGGCVCSMVADEPEDYCPVHGHPWPKCYYCGRFVRRKSFDELVEMFKKEDREVSRA